MVGYAAVPWAVMFALCIRRCGRKFPFIFASACATTSFLVYYFSSTAIQILAAEAIEGIIFASNITVSMLIITEFTSPQNRGMFLTMKSATKTIAVCIANAIGTFFHWKNIPILGIVCSVYSFGALLWPESPYWLASKGRFSECIASHRWLKGTCDKAEKELENLIKLQKEYRASRSKRKVAFSWIDSERFIANFTSKQFYKPTLLTLLMVALYNLSGKLVCVVYATQIIKRVTDNESTAYTGMLILDVITVLGMYCGCVLTKILNRRTLLFGASLCGALSLFILSFYLYLVKFLVVPENAIIFLILLVVYSISISCGPLVMATSVCAELIPLRYQTLSIIVTVTYSGIFQATILKISPDLIRNCGIHGAFLFFAVSFSVCIYLFYKFLPETKDKTLQEIENCFVDDLPESQELKQLKDTK